MVTIIAAVARNGVIGKDNDLPWYIPEDLARFKEITKGHPVIMGWKTFISILQRMLDRTGTAKLLPGRVHFVVTSKSEEQIKSILADLFPDFDYEEARKRYLVICRGVGSAVQRAEAMDDEVFGIGGSRLFNELLGSAGKMELTEIHKDYEGDVYFPQFDASQWDRKEELHEGYSFTTYTRRRH